MVGLHHTFISFYPGPLPQNCVLRTSKLLPQLTWQKPQTWAGRLSFPTENKWTRTSYDSVQAVTDYITAPASTSDVGHFPSQPHSLTVTFGLEPKAPDFQLRHHSHRPRMLFIPFLSCACTILKEPFPLLFVFF